jgi:nicotinate-nucleotide pyrophosphorylase (carboxylating)
MSLTLRDRLALALAEDLGPGDLTTDATVDPGRTGRAVLVAKQDVVVSGQAAAKLAFELAAAHYGAFVAYRIEVADGEAASAGATLATLSGDLRAILVGERLALNLLMRLCGVATHVRRILQDVGPTTFRAVDTRKTTPLWRDLEKAAVRHGGGHNHRFGLFDGVLVKDNHIAACGSVGEAVRRARAEVHHLVRVQCEVERLDQIPAALDAGADGLLLDNMDDATLAEAVDLVRGRWPHAFLEASGNMTAERLRRIAAFGLDVVSVGGFVHQATWADLSLRITAGGPATPVAP